MQKRCRISYLLLIKILLVTFAASREKSECPFSPDFKQYTDSTSNGTIQFCAKLFFGKETWDFSDSYCKLHYSSLTYKVGLNSTLHREWINRGFSSDELLWVGIRRRANYFVIESTGEIFREKANSSSLKYWGAHWLVHDVRDHDCVALNVSSGDLVTRDCNSHFYQICDDRDVLKLNKLPEESLCPDGVWELSYYLLGQGKKCISMFKPQPQISAVAICEEHKSRLATADEYDILFSSNSSLFNGATAYWANPENYGSCVFKTFQIVNGSRNEHPENCSKPLPFTCVKELDKRDVKVWISPSNFRPFPSTSTCASNPDLFICNVKIDGKQISGKKKEVLYQWYKDNIPIAERAYAFRMSYLAEPMRRDPSITDIVTRQGTYHCEVRILGSWKSYSSPKIDFFYSDISTYILNINSIVPYDFQDYSDHDFTEHMIRFDTSIMAKQMSKLVARHGSATWDFHSKRAHDGIESLKLLLFINRSSSMLDEEIYQEIKSIFNYSSIDTTTSRNISFSVSSADVCFSKDTENVTCEGNIRWPTSKQTVSVNTENMCLDKSRRLVKRKCKANVTTKAEWSEFNCSSCQDIEPRVKGLNIWCSEGYTKLVNTNLCFKIHYEEETWHDAYRICSESSSYMLNELYPDIAPLHSFWLSYTYSHGKIQQVGRKSQTSNFKYSWKNINLDSHCISVVLLHKNYMPVLENCDRKLPFICVQDPFEVVSSVKFSSTWHKLSAQQNCYYFAKKDVYYWLEAKKECQLMVPRADLPIGILKVEPYRYFKMLIHQMFANSDCQSTLWWMNLRYDGKMINFLETSAEYVDWDPYTNFDLTEAYGAITLLANEEIYWTLQNPREKHKYICEIQDCEDVRPTQAYVEYRSEESIYVLTGTSDYLYYLQNFSLKCIPSGWFLTHSLTWYKDGILLDISSDQLSFTQDSYSSLSLQDLLHYQGYYWCSVDQLKPRQTTVSSKVLFRFPGIHTYVLSLKSHSQIYLEACALSMLSEISLSDNQSINLNECFRKSLDTLNIFHLAVRNLTCNSTHADITLHIYNANAGEEDIFKYIQKADFLRLSKECHVELESIFARSTVSCYGEKTALKMKNLTWPTTPIGENAIPDELCLTAKGRLVERKCLGDFNTGAVWAPVSVTDCSTTESGVTVQLHQLLLNHIPASFTVIYKLRSLTSSPDDLVPADVQIASEILMNFSRQQSLEYLILNPVVETINNIIDVPQDVLKETGNSSNQIIESFENIASAVDIQNKSIQVAAANLAVSIHPITVTSSAIPNCVILPDWSRNLTTLFNASLEDFKNNVNDSKAGIVLPPLLVVKYGNRSDRVIYQIRHNFNYVENLTVVSAVIQASFKDVSVYNIWPPVKMVFKLNEEFKETNYSSVKCVFWDQRLNDSFGGWSYKGCLMNEWRGDVIECSCNHLTSFTVILELNPKSVVKAHEKALTYITYVGCSLSCFGLGVIILTFICFRQWRKSVKNKALFNLSACLVSFLILFMAGIDKTSSSMLCLIIAISLHYLLLASFAWMLVSAFLMYLYLVKVLDTYVPRLIQKAMLFAYGVPAAIVIIILSYRHQLYCQDNYCWLSQEVFYYAIAGPVLTILLVNFIFFGLILYANTCGKSKIYLRSNQDTRKQNLARAKALFYTSVLLGLSWIFGFLAVGKAKLVFQYLFAITTTLQGFLFFLFFIVKQKSASDMWRKVIFPTPVSEKTRVSHISGSATYSNRIINDSESGFENVYRNVIFKLNHPYSPYA